MRAVVAGLAELEAGREISFDEARAQLDLKQSHATNTNQFRGIRTP